MWPDDLLRAGRNHRTSRNGAISEQDPAEVAAALHESAQAIADRFEGVTGAQWQRTGNRSDGASFTVETFARYFMHDPVHHLYDVTGRRAVPT